VSADSLRIEPASATARDRVAAFSGTSAVISGPCVAEGASVPVRAPAEEKELATELGPKLRMLERRPQLMRTMSKLAFFAVRAVPILLE
jgi:hypothetical protein